MSFYKYHAIVTTVTLIITLSLPSTDKMYRTFLIHVLFICILTVAALSTRAAENHADKIVAQIMETRDAIIANAGANSADEFVFLSFWDFDGTLLQGDCSEGLTIADKPIYKGLAQLTIEAGHSSIYPTTADIHRFWRDYRHMEESIGKWLAYPYIVQMLHGASTAEVSSLAKKHFKQTLVPYYFKSSLHMLNKLEENGIHNHIISASADIFVDAAAPTLALPLERFNGIKVKVKNGKLTEQLEYPVTWADGKTEKLRQIIADTASRNPGKKVVVLAAFGNSYSTDGAFMKYVATQKLPAGSPVTLMINGGTCPEEYRDLFTEVNQSETSNNIE